MTNEEAVALRLMGLEPVCFNCAELTDPPLPECVDTAHTEYFPGAAWKNLCPRFSLSDTPKNLHFFVLKPHGKNPDPDHD